ncbi:MAG: hypothetical protein K2Q18_06115 [Bdellovibrionales bacterium]|nr:hypothetical protein [Bdellovibrionales bacterium]
MMDFLEEYIEEFKFTRNKDGLIWLDCNSGRPESKQPNRKEWKELTNKFTEKLKKCNRCEAITGLQLHHWTYETFGKEREQDVELLSNSCHKKIHNKAETALLNNHLPFSPDNWVLVNHYYNETGELDGVRYNFHSLEDIEFDLCENEIFENVSFRGNKILSKLDFIKLIANYNPKQGLILKWDGGTFQLIKLKDCFNPLSVFAKSGHLKVIDI